MSGDLRAEARRVVMETSHTAQGAMEAVTIATRENFAAGLTAYWVADAALTFAADRLATAWRRNGMTDDQRHEGTP